MMDKRFKGVVFDMDGVVIDTEAMVLDCWDKAARHFGIEDMRPVAKSCIGINSKDTKKKICDHYGDAIDYDEVNSYKRVLIKERIDKGLLDPKPGIREFLSFLKDNGFKTALATSSSGRSAVYELDKLDLTKFFDVMITGEMIPCGKPAPDIFLAACKALGESPEDLIGVEDSHNGIRSCHAAGLFTVMVPDLLPPTEEIRELADAVFDNVLEVKTLLA